MGRVLIFFGILVIASSSSSSETTQNSSTTEHFEQRRVLSPTEQSWDQAGFKDPVVSKMSQKNFNHKGSKTTHEIDFTIVMFKQTSWKQEKIRERMSRLSQIFGKCGIRINPPTLVVADSPIGTAVLDRPLGRDTEISQKLPASAVRPVMFYVEAELEGRVAYAWHKRTGANTVIQDTAWITHEVEEWYKELHDPSFSVDAHELGHILCDCYHLPSGNKNLMAEHFDDLNDTLTENQCDEFKKSKYARKL